MPTGMDPSSSLFVFWQSLLIVGVAELFDKTWFMGLLLALRYKKLTVFTGSVLALLLHTVLAAALGLAFAKMLSQRVLNFMAAFLFFTFAVLYAKDCYFSDPKGDALAAGKAEAAKDCGLEPNVDEAVDSGAESAGCTAAGAAVAPNTSAAQSGDESTGSTSGASSSEEGATGDARSELLNVSSEPMNECMVFAKCFMVVFIAEWGDRTQIAMIGQHASRPLIPVFLGSSVAFFLLTMSAVGTASLLAGRSLSERLVFGISSACFTLFAILALKDALSSR